STSCWRSTVVTGEDNELGSCGHSGRYRQRTTTATTARVAANRGRSRTSVIAAPPRLRRLRGTAPGEEIAQPPSGRSEEGARRRRRNHEPVGDPVLDYVDVGERAECSAEHRDARETRAVGVQVDTGSGEEERAADRRADRRSRFHGSRGLAVARAFTVSVGT